MASVYCSRNVCPFYQVCSKAQDTNPTCIANLDHSQEKCGAYSSLLSCGQDSHFFKKTLQEKLCAEITSIFS